MLDVARLISEALLAYSRVDNRAPIPYRSHTSTPDHSRIGHAGLCGLQHGFSKARVPITHPENAASLDPQTTHMLQAGEYMAMMHQEALLYYAQSQMDLTASVELDVVVNDIKAVGRYDVLIEYREMGVLGEHEVRRMLLEYKNTEGMKRRSVGQPSVRYCWQLLGYSMSTGILDSSIVTCSKWGFQVYYLTPIDYNDPEKGFELWEQPLKISYEQVDGHWEIRYTAGSKVPFIPDYGDNWNQLDILSYKRVREEHRNLHEWMDKVHQWLKDNEGNEPLLPFPEKYFDNPLDSDIGWLCVRSANTSNWRKTTKLVPNCEYFGHCYPNVTVVDNVIPVKKNEDGTRYMPIGA